MVKKIFLFGSNYKGTDAELQACLSDCRSIRDFFKTHGYLVEEYLSEKTLSWTDLKPKLTAWIQSLRLGDIEVIYYSGHGFQLKDKSGDEKDGQDEAIYFSEKSYATDDDIRILLQLAKPGVNLFLLFDCCHSGSMADLPYSLKDLGVVKANIVSISGCTDPNVSYEDGTAGYLTSKFGGFSKIPVVVFWNVAGNLSDFTTTTKHQKIVQLAGFSKDLYEIFFKKAVLTERYEMPLAVYDSWTTALGEPKKPFRWSSIEITPRLK